MQECTDNLTRSENKISKLQQTLRSVQDEKANIESKLTQKSSNLQNVEEILRQKSEELNHLREKVVSLELQLGSGAEERGQCEVKFNLPVTGILFKISFMIFHCRIVLINRNKPFNVWNPRRDNCKKNYPDVKDEHRNWICIK